jgi:hypothetical protein
MVTNASSMCLKVIRLVFAITSGIFYFVALKGYEAINIKIARGQLKNIHELPKIPKKTKESSREQTEISVDVFKSTMYELIPCF